MTQVITFQTPLLKSNMHLLYENECGILIDPYDAPELYPQIEKLAPVVDYIVLTHEHYDHISGANILRERYHCPVICGAACAKGISDPIKNFSHYFNAYVSLQSEETVSEEFMPKEDFSTTADGTFSDISILLWQGHELELRETPGHSLGSICITVDGTSLFSGDSLLPNRKATVRFPGGDRRMYEEKTLPFLRTLSMDTIVYPGHYEAFRLGDHPALNPTDQTILRRE